MKATRDERGFALSPAGWVGVLLLVGAAALLLARWPAGGRPEIVQAARPAEEPAVLEPAPSAERSPDGEGAGERETIGEAPKLPTAVEILQEHWGERWEVIRDRNRASEEWLERYPVSELRPWEEVSELVLERALAEVAKEREVEAYLVLEGERGRIDLLHDTVLVSTTDGVAESLDPVREQARAQEQALREASRVYWDEVERVLTTRWREGSIEHHPILASYDPPPADALYVHSGVAHGWTYAIALRASEEAELARLREELESLRAAAFQELALLLGAD
jgi:hypothetical protein